MEHSTAWGPPPASWVAPELARSALDEPARRAAAGGVGPRPVATAAPVLAPVLALVLALG